MTTAALPPSPAPPPAHRSSSWPLAWLWAGLIVYASLHPFGPWRWPVLLPGQLPHELLWLPVQRHNRFDLWANFAGYLPLGLLLALAWLRAGLGPLRTLLQALLFGSLLSLLMEWTQNLLPLRVPSRHDWLLNSAGTLVGALVALLLLRLGVLAHWQRLRDVIFVPHGTLGLALLLSWPIGLLFPPPVPLATGQALERLLVVLDAWLADTPLHRWIPLPDPVGALEPGTEVSVIALGLLAPCVVSFVMLRRVRHRILTLALLLLAGVGATALSTLLNFGPEHAMSWLTPPVLPGLLVGLGLGLGLAFAPRRLVAALGLVALTLLIMLVTQAGTDPYFSLSLTGWERGRFIRFHGLAQWIGWLWPFAALLFLLIQVADPHRIRAPASPSRSG